MEFDEVVVKESPGLCRCCLSEGCYKDLGSEYNWMGDTEIYADMLLECFDIGISQHAEGPNGPNRLICEVCITRLRDSCNFKKQVLDSEKRFIDMLHRGEFRSKAAELPVMKQEAEALEVEYLDDLDFGDDGDDQPKTDTEPEQAQAEDITVTTLPMKRGRGRPRKSAPEKPERRAKVAKVEQPKASKAPAKGLKTKEYHTTYLDRLASVRRNIVLILHFGGLTPFHWTTKGFKCFYCNKDMADVDTLTRHTETKHQMNIEELEAFIPKRIISKDVPIKVDVRHVSCKECREPMSNLDELMSHIKTAHDEEYDYDAGVCVFPFVLTRDIHCCVLCEDKFDNFPCMMTHMYKKHITHSFICQICGRSFKDQVRMKRHFKNSHIGFRCKHCGKMFDGFHKLDRHKQIIHGQTKAHNCLLCSATFQNDYQVKVHMGKAHNVEKYRVKCELCPKVCSTKGAMLLHVQSMHSEAKFECDVCDYKTGIKWVLKLHNRKHFGEKNYECSICKRKFGRSSNLRTHMKVHTGNFGRVCRFCRQGFVDTDSLTAHELASHGQE